MQPHTQVGAAGMVLNRKGQVLVVQEKFGFEGFWKLPGGRGPSRRRGPGGAVQETGIQCEFQCIAVFREHHGAAHSATDFYTIFCCLLSEEAYGTEQLVGPAAQAARG